MTNGDDRATARRAAVVIGVLLATAAGLFLIYATRRVLSWIGIAAFFAVALHPAVNWAQRRLARPRWLATLLVFLAALGLLAALTALILVPLADEMGRLVEQFPRLMRDAAQGRGPIGEALERFHLRRYVESQQAQIESYGTRVREPSAGLLRGALTTAAGVVTISVLAYLMVLQAPRLAAGTLGLVPARHRGRLRVVGRDCARTITGYLSGNLLISVICGALTFVVLALLGVPYAGVLALLVAIADLVPLVGATVGAAIAAGAGFVHSPRAGIVILIFCVVYQQVENHVLQPLIFSRIVRLNPLTVLVSVLLGADLAGIAGALLAIPAVGIIQVILRDLRAHRTTAGRPPAGPDPPPAPG
ncbi:AI-2E family transporter [Solwaraspora sp. WMMD1047]|uniref:AI-2E family transporter n=1 Tax=Solwaraspora sp. WMMD1047 TaxID=3016102 RepID=UPI0024168FEF|nr:AI-2E family transporter [Solwaraspora sp. WMMD1047]MDG4831295.1 AI-2E family transporter [Solwaraspora sp. WMMD1047]